MSNTIFDLIVIGGGPAGYVGAIRAAQLGLKTVCIEKRKTLGGTCLNVGCIPSKALLDSSERYYQTKNKLSKHGIIVDGVQIDLGQMQKRKEGVVRQLTTGIAGLFKKNGIEHVLGHGKLVSNSNGLKTVEVQTEAGVRTLQGKNILIATGSEPTQLPFLPFNGKTVLSSTEALELAQVPKHLVVVGGGVIGLEMGSVWLRLGAKVTVIEFQDRIVPGMDKQTALELQKSLIKQGMDLKLAHKCLGAKPADNGWTLLEAEEIATGKKIGLEADVILVCTGRKPYTENLGLEKVGLTTDKQGRLEINDHFETSTKGIYAVGDVVRGPMLAHKAEEEGIAAVEIMAGQAGHVNYNAIPGVVYTWPELAGVGATEDDLKAKGIAYKVGTFPFLANGRAKAIEEAEGLVKIISDAKTDRVLGAHIVGAYAGDLIAEIVSVIEFGGSAEDIARTSHAHPSLSEIVKEAAMAVNKNAIHF